MYADRIAGPLKKKGRLEPFFVRSCEHIVGRGWVGFDFVARSGVANDDVRTGTSTTGRKVSQYFLVRRMPESSFG